MSWPHGIRTRIAHFSNAHATPGNGGVADIAPGEVTAAPDEENKSRFSICKRIEE